MTEVLRTLSEIQATCTKATRGSGCPWGLAEEAGFAARILEAHGLPGAESVAALLKAPRACACTEGKGARACGIAEMAALSDDLPVEKAEYGPVAAPGLLAVPCILDDSGWRVEWPGGALECGPDGVSLSGAPMPTRADSVTITRTTMLKVTKAPDWRSRSVDSTAWAELEELAALTYVPETEASRVAGAGPDEADKD